MFNWNELKDIRGNKKEHFVVFFLDTRNQEIKREVVSVGILNENLVHPREVFEPAIHRFLARRKLKLKEERAWIRSIPKKKDQIHFAIDAREGVHIGSVGLNEINRRDNYAVFGIVIGDKRYWSKGYGTEAMKLIVDHGFRRLKLHRIELDVYDYNARGIKLYRRLGFKMEGKKRERVFWKGKYYDEFQMGILRNEWKC